MMKEVSGLSPGLLGDEKQVVVLLTTVTQCPKQHGRYVEGDLLMNSVHSCTKVNSRDHEDSFLG